MTLIKTREIQPPSGWRLALYRLPVYLYRIGLGGFFGRRFIMLHHTGRHSGQIRHTVLEVVQYDKNTGRYIIASGFGEHSQWYKNLMCHPDAKLECLWKTVDVRAERLNAPEAEREMVSYGKRNPRAAQMVAGLIGYAHDGSEEDLREFSKVVPLIRLTPARATNR